MFFATSRLGSRRHPTNQAQLPLADVTNEIVHPSRLLMTEEVILGICMVITGLLYLFAQMPAAVLTTAAAGRSLMTQSAASLMPTAAEPAGQDGLPLIDAAQPLFRAIRRATDLEDQAAFGPETRAAWQEVVHRADDLAFEPIATGDGTLRLWMLTAERERAAALENQIDALLGQQREGLTELRRLQLTPVQLAALAVPTADRTAAEAAAAETATEMLAVSRREAAEVLAEPLRSEVISLCRLLAEARKHAETIARCRSVINFDHWMAAAEMAATPEGLQARAALSRADRAFAAGEFAAAEAAYEEGLTAWQASLIANPQLAERPAVVEELSRQITRYREVLEELGRPFDAAFSLQNMLRTGL